MTRSMRSALRAIGLVVLVGAALAILRPWTVRPLQTAPPAAFDAGVYAGRAWPRLLDEASRTAVDATAARQLRRQRASPEAPGRKSVFVRVSGVLTAVDRQSRVGIARVRLDGGQGDAAVQIGPVIRGTALRDATTFIRFNDFANQFEFAAVSNALHERVLRDVVGPVDLDALVGKPIAVLGAAALASATPAEAPLDVVPLELRAGGAS